MRTTNKAQGGAVLLLLAMVLGLGAASVFMLAWGHTQTDNARVQRSLAALRDARAALVGFALVHGRLPRPAVSAQDGREAPNGCATEAVCTGFLPWAALGVGSTDAWGMLLRYSVTPVYTVAPLQRTSAIATKTILTRSGDGSIHYLIGNPACSLGSQCLAALVYSSGARNFGTSEAGIARLNASSGNSDEAANAKATLDFMQRAATGDGAAGGSFDDLLIALDPAYLYQQMAKARVLP